MAESSTTWSGPALPPLEQTVRNWYPRFLADGLDYGDLERTLAGIRSWAEWPRAWAALGDAFAAEAERALAAGHTASAGEHLTRASAAYHFGQFMELTDLALRREIAAKKVGCHTRALPFMEPPGERVMIPFEDVRLPAYLRLPRGAGPWPCIVLLPGLDSSKEELYTFEQRFLARGVATLSPDGPGQGETWWAMPWRPDYERAASAVVDYLESRPEVRSDRLGVFGRSFGGYLAPRCAGLEPRFRCCVGLAGPYDLSYWDELQPLIRQDFAHFCGARSDDEARHVAAQVSLDGVAERIRCPLLIVHGELDSIIPVGDAHRIVEAATACADRQLLLYPDGNHVCENRATLYRPLVADWVADRLRST